MGIYTIPGSRSEHKQVGDHRQGVARYQGHERQQQFCCIHSVQYRSTVQFRIGPTCECTVAVVQYARDWHSVGGGDLRHGPTSAHRAAHGHLLHRQGLSPCVLARGHGLGEGVAGCGCHDMPGTNVLATRLGRNRAHPLDDAHSCGPEAVQHFRGPERDRLVRRMRMALHCRGCGQCHGGDNRTHPSNVSSEVYGGTP